MIPLNVLFFDLRTELAFRIVWEANIIDVVVVVVVVVVIIIVTSAIEVVDDVADTIIILNFEKIRAFVVVVATFFVFGNWRIGLRGRRLTLKNVNV